MTRYFVFVRCHVFPNKVLCSAQRANLRHLHLAGWRISKTRKQHGKGGGGIPRVSPLTFNGLHGVIFKSRIFHVCENLKSYFYRLYVANMSRQAVNSKSAMYRLCKTTPPYSIVSDLVPTRRAEDVFKLGDRLL
jgi:hypothetical protein